MPEWFPAELVNAWLIRWAGEIAISILAGWAAGGISLVLTGLRSRGK